jgi:hypothetical protein
MTAIRSRLFDQENFQYQSIYLAPENVSKASGAVFNIGGMLHREGTRLSENTIVGPQLPTMQPHPLGSRSRP